MHSNRESWEVNRHTKHCLATQAGVWLRATEMEISDIRQVHFHSRFACYNGVVRDKKKTMVQLCLTWPQWQTLVSLANTSCVTGLVQQCHTFASSYLQPIKMSEQSMLQHHWLSITNASCPPTRNLLAVIPIRFTSCTRNNCGDPT